MAAEPTFPLIYMAPVDGVLLELPAPESIGERLPDIDTDAISEQARRWVVDAAGRRVRLRVEFGRVDRCEILPGRPPMDETLQEMRREAVRARIHKIPGGRGAIAWAKSAGVGALITAAIAMLVHGIEIATNPAMSLLNGILHTAALVFMVGGAAVVLYGASRRCGFIIAGLCALVLGGGALAPARLWAMWEYGDIGPTGGNPVALVFVLGFNMLIPGLMVLGAAVTLLANGGLYAQLARLERGPRVRLPGSA